LLVCSTIEVAEVPLVSRAASALAFERRGKKEFNSFVREGRKKEFKKLIVDRVLSVNKVRGILSVLTERRMWTQIQAAE
jgi:hypothetical protein